MARLHVVLACLLAATLMAAQACPLVRNFKQNKYKALLSLDGGVFRGVIQIEMLANVESAIKQVMIDQQLVSYSSPSDFDVLLSDYFDLVAGTSVGSYLAAYLTSNGGDLHEMYPAQFTARPGSAAGALQMFNILAGVFASAPPSNPRNWTRDSVALGEVVSRTLTGFFGNRSMHSYAQFTTAFLATWTDYSDFTMAYNFVNPKLAMGGYVRPAGPTQDQDEIRLNRNFYLWQCARGSGSDTELLAPFNATTTPDTPAVDATSILVADGCFGAQEPAAMAIPHMLQVLKVPLDRLAVLSFGTTVLGANLNYTQLMARIPNVWQFGWQCETNLAISVTAHRAMFTAIGRPDAYVRVDRMFQTNQACPDVDEPTCLAWKKAVRESTPGANGENYPIFKAIGAALFKQYETDVKAFIKKFVVLNGCNHV